MNLDVVLLQPGFSEPSAQASPSMWSPGPTPHRSAKAATGPWHLACADLGRVQITVLRCAFVARQLPHRSHIRHVRWLPFLHSSSQSEQCNRQFSGLAISPPSLVQPLLINDTLSLFLQERGGLLYSFEVSAFRIRRVQQKISVKCQSYACSPLCSSGIVTISSIHEPSGYSFHLLALPFMSKFSWAFRLFEQNPYQYS